MKFKNLLLVAGLGFLLRTSCSSKTSQDIIDCLAESFLLTIKNNPDSIDPKLINFQMDYTGSFSLQSVTWYYGDGQSQVVNGTTASHNYTMAGTYEVKTKVVLVHGSKTCGIEPKKNITVN